MKQHQQARPRADILKQMLAGLKQDGVICEIYCAVSKKYITPQRWLHHGNKNLNPERAYDQALVRRETDTEYEQRPIKELVLLRRMKPAQQKHQHKDQPWHA